MLSYGASGFDSSLARQRDTHHTHNNSLCGLRVEVIELMRVQKKKKEEEDRDGTTFNMSLNFYYFSSVLDIISFYCVTV